MIFTSPRFVVVDDDSRHLNAILNVFQELGTPCLGVTYQPEGLDKANFEGVRALFLDLHLIDHTPTTDDKQHFAHIAGLLQDNISRSGGPFVLVVWTAHEQSVEPLKTYLDEAIDEASPARPLAIVSLPKDQFINVGTGGVLADKARDLRDAVAATIEDIPQLAALLSWEADVQAAASETLATLMELVPDEGQHSAEFADRLGGVLARLAGAAVGEPHVAADPRAAITSALAPILADRIVNQRESEAASDVWKSAVAGNSETALDPMSLGKVNRMLHIAVPPETIKPIDWGAVVKLPDAWWTDEKMKKRFDVTRCELLEQEHMLRKEEGERCRPRLVRIGAACDHAQNRPGPLTYLLALEVPVGCRRKGKLPASVWSSPTLAVNEDDPFVLEVNARYALNMVKACTEEWQSVYRLREQLLMQLIAHAGSYLTRPGIVSLR